MQPSDSPNVSPANAADLAQLDELTRSWGVDLNHKKAANAADLAQLDELTTAIIGDPLKPISRVKPGVRTTEFWLTLIMLIAAITSMICGAIDAPWALGASGAAVAIYTICRRSLKLETLVTTRNSPDRDPAAQHHDS